MEVTPIIVDPTQYAHSYSPDFQMFGPYERSGVLFLVFGRGPLTAVKVRIYKSTNYGLTWAVQDAANAPDYIDKIACDFDGTSTLYVATHKVTTETVVQYTTFNLDTCLWGSSVVRPPDGTGWGTKYVLPDTIAIARRTDGSVVITVAGQVKSLLQWERVYYTIYTGTWSAFVEVSDHADYDDRVALRAHLKTSNDVVHWYYSAIPGAGWGPPAPGQNNYYRQLSALNVMSAAQTLSTNPNIGKLTGVPCISGANIVFPYVYYGTPDTLHCFIGTPYTSTAPVFTDETVYSTAGSSAKESVALVDGGTLYVYWIQQDGTTDCIYRASRGAGWSAPEMIHDEYTFPTPSGIQSWYYLHLYVDWTLSMGPGESITVSTWDGGGLTVIDSYLVGHVAHAWFGGGAGGAPYTITNYIDTNLGHHYSYAFIYTWPTPPGGSSMHLHYLSAAKLSGVRVGIATALIDYAGISVGYYLQIGPRTYTYTPTGGLVTGGSAPSSAHIPVRTYTPSGGLVTGGSAPTRYVPAIPFGTTTGSECVPVITKKTAEAIDLELVWSSFLPSWDAISGSTWSVTWPITLGGESFTSSVTRARIYGGVAGEDYLVQNTITTQEGRTEERTVLVRVRTL